MYRPICIALVSLGMMACSTPQERAKTSAFENCRGVSEQQSRYECRKQEEQIELEREYKKASAAREREDQVVQKQTLLEAYGVEQDDAEAIADLTVPPLPPSQQGY